MLTSLDKVRNLKDPLKQFTLNWQLAFRAGSPLANVINSEDLMLRCQTFDMPTIKGDETKVTWAGFDRQYAGKQTRSGDWTVKFVEVWDAKITDMFRIWSNQYHNYKNGTISLLTEYTADVNVELVNPDLYDPVPSGITKYDVRLYDVYPTQVKLPNINASSSDAVEIDCTFHYNFFLLGEEND